MPRTDKMREEVVMSDEKELLPESCPFCDKSPQWGLTKRTGCQLHGDPIQHVTLGCNNRDCKVNPKVMGGDRYANGETGEFFKLGERVARDKAIAAWNTRVTNPHTLAMEEALGALRDCTCKGTGFVHVGKNHLIAGRQAIASLTKALGR